MFKIAEFRLLLYPKFLKNHLFSISINQILKIFFVDLFNPNYDQIFDFLCMALRKQHEIFFIGPIENNENFKVVKNQKFVRRIWKFNNYVRSIYKFTKKEKPDIIHFNFELRDFGLLKSGITIPLLLFLIRSIKTKIIFTLHSIYVVKEKGKWTLFEHQDVPLPRPILKILIKLFIKSVCKLSDRIIIYNKSAKNGLVEYFNIPEDKIDVTYLAVEKKHYSQDSLKRKKFEEKFKNKKIILCFGNISPRKGLDTSIMAMKRVVKKHPNYILVISGISTSYNKDFELDLRKLPKTINLEKNVVFTGFLEDEEVDTIFDLADMALYVYKPAAIGTLSLHHAIQHHTPIIASNTDTFKEILEENDAMLIEPDNEFLLSNTILQLIENDELRKKLRNRMENLSSKYSWEKTVEDYVNSYEKLSA